LNKSLFTKEDRDRNKFQAPLRPKKTLYVLAAILTSSLIYGVYTGKFGILRTGGVLLREDSPIAFWLMILAHVLIVAVTVNLAKNRK